MAAAQPFEASTVAFASSHDEGCGWLRELDLEPLGFITDASNGTMLCRLGDPDQHLFAIYKPEAHERPLWDFPGALWRREVAAYELSEQLGWGVVPPTVERDGPRGVGSVQLFVPHDPSQHYFTLVEEAVWAPQLVRLAAFDMVANNADRKGGHVLAAAHEPRLYGIDNGLCFHVDPKLRTVIWDLPHVPFDPAWQADLRALAACLAADDGPFPERMHELLTISEVEELAVRAAQVADMDAIPDVDPDDRWYPWPPV